LAPGGSNRLLSLPHAAEILDVPVRRLRDNWRAWRIPAFKVGRELRIRERDLVAWVNKQATNH
jgi:excisionase family DNA binding protein